MSTRATLALIAALVFSGLAACVPQEQQLRGSGGTPNPISTPWGDTGGGQPLGSPTPRPVGN